MTAIKTRVLIFDDDTSYIRLLKRQADSMNIDTITCKTMDEYCLSAIDGNFDVALIDYHLEDFKGSTVAKAIERKPVVIMSSDGSLAMTKSPWSDQIVEFVRKDSGPSEVLARAVWHASYQF